MATLKLGGKVINLTSEQSSLVKQESLEDTLKTIQAIGADAIVLRHKDDAASEKWAPELKIPLINGGAGKKEHPSQCLLDLLTLKQEFKTLSGLHIGIIGDIKHSRVASSLIQIAEKLKLKISLLAPEDLLPSGFKNSTWSDLYQCDAIMCLRYQMERMEGMLELKTLVQDFCLTKERFKHFKSSTIIMHPAPINHGIEISTEMVHHAQSRIFKQMELGVYARMSIFEYLFNQGPWNE
jgi:aspartate carbamoyltransferase catalytic subunit